jgi:hypothetical protein
MSFRSGAANHGRIIEISKGTGKPDEAGEAESLLSQIPTSVMSRA